MADRGTIERVARFFTQALAPLKVAVTDPARFRQLWSRMGWRVDAPPPAYASIGIKVDGATLRLDALGDAPPFPDVLQLASAVADAFNEITAMTAVPAGITDPGYVAEIRQQLFDFLLTEALSATAPSWFRGLGALGVIDDGYVDATATRPEFVHRVFRWDALGAVLRDPAGIPQRAIGWGTPALRFDKFANVMSELFFAWGFPVSLERPEPELLQAYGLDVDEIERPPHSVVVPFFNLGPLEAAFRAHALPPAPGKLPGVAIDLTIPDPIARVLRLTERIGLRVRPGSNFNDGVAVLLRPGDVSIRFPSAPTAALPSGGVGFGFDFTPKDPTLLLGSPGRTRVEWKGAAVDVNATVANGQTDVALSVAVNGLALVIAGGGESLFDGFLEKILGSGESRVALPLGIEWGGTHGIRFQGSGGFEVQVHPHLSLGPIHVDDVIVRALAVVGGPPDVRLDLAATLGGSLGPLDFFVQGIGLRAEVTFSKGNLGPLDLQLGFLPPNGVGLGVDVGGFKGGGFLILDAAKGEYAGGLELDFQGLVSVKALGILNTKFPDGHRGFSLVLIISAEFFPIQLGFGFTLVGVGGLLGINRTIDEDALREGIHQGAIESVLFPHDLVANAPRIVNDLRRLFPPFEDHFLVGPMVKFGWGTPTILSLEFGLLLEIPRPAFVIIGRLRVGLPFQDVALFDIRVTFAGGIDFALGQFWFDGTLYGSRLLAFSLTGDLAVRLYWKDNANFILTAGGFHPAYTPPPMALGTLQRLAITIFDGNPRLRCETYFAITSNTVQFGAKAELYFGIKVFNVYGFIAYDVLIQFDPFRFIAALAAELAVRSGSEVLLGIRVDALLEGPTPWHAKGTGHFEISFIISISIDVDFEVTIGESRHDTLPPIEVMPRLVEAFAATTSWRAVFPAGNSAQVSLRAIDPDVEGLVLHPFGSLEISQKVVPLNLPVQRIGTQRTADGSLFAVDHVLLGSTPGQLAPVREQFAPAQYIDMTDDQKLSRRSFETYEAGVQVGGGERVNADRFIPLSLTYEVVYVPEHRTRRRFRLARSLFDAFAKAGAVSQSPLSGAQTGASALGTPRVHYAGEQFTVASTTDLTLHDTSLVFSSEAEAHAAMTRIVESDPTLHDAVQVVPLSLANAA